jgi:hypothetical protein
MRCLIVAVFLMSACDGFIDIEEYPQGLSWAGYATPIKDQLCEDCYTYAALGLVETRYNIDKGVVLDLSEQNIRNCMGYACDASGGAATVLDHIQQSGVMLEEDVPGGKWESCEDPSKKPFFHISSYEYIYSPPRVWSERKALLLRALQVGPAAIAIDSWFGIDCVKGICRCRREHGSGHYVVVLGYNEWGQSFIVKNSHGESKPLTIFVEEQNLCGFASEIIWLEPGSVIQENR